MLAWFIAYLIVILSYSLANLYLIGRVSASAVSIAGSAALPIASLLFLVPLFGGFPFSLWSIVAVLMTAVGLVAYRLRPESKTGVSCWQSRRRHRPTGMLHRARENSTPKIGHTTDYNVQ